MCGFVQLLSSTAATDAGTYLSGARSLRLGNVLNLEPGRTTKDGKRFPAHALRNVSDSSSALAALMNPTIEPESPLARVVERNIAALVGRRRQEEADRSRQDRCSDAISAFAGSMRFVYVHLVLLGLYIAINSGWTPLRPFDPTFFLLSTVASVEAIFLSTFVLITQNRMSAVAEKRAELDLQISLLAEHEITRLITLVAELGKKAGVQSASDPALQELQRDVAPEAVLDQLDRENTPKL
jgi:uncharacterized membrane protein